MTETGDRSGDALAKATAEATDAVQRRVPEQATTSFREMSLVWRGVVGVAVGLFLVLWPDVALNLAVAIAGAALAGLGLISGWHAIRERQTAVVLRTALDVVIGLALIVVSTFSASLIAAALAIGLLLRGLVDARAAVRAFRAGNAGVWYAVRSFAQLAAALAVAVLGTGVVLVILLFIGITWAIGGVVAIVLATNDRRAGANPVYSDLATSSVDPTHVVVMTWFRSQDVGDEARKVIVEKLIFEGEDFNRRVARYASLMTFATAIAALGIQTDSTAVVIGAMLVAPLMTPIMATSLSLVMGLPARAVRSLGLVGSGVAIAIGLSFLIARYAPGLVEIEANSQITARTAPTLLDLLIALAAGCAGGYAVCRPDVSDSLPGVAIAVALVPPLAVVGITLSGGQFSLAAGAFLLFLTNLVGIIVASALIFAATGVIPWSDLARNAAQLRQASLTVLAALVVVSIPLAVTGRQILADATDQRRASTASQRWLDDILERSGDAPSEQAGEGLVKLQIVRVNIEGDIVEVVVIGDGDLGDGQDLADRLAVELERPVSLELRLIPETRVSLTSTGS